MALNFIKNRALCTVACFFVVWSFSFAVGSENKRSDKMKKPNIIILMSDDQDVMLGSMDVMHYTQNEVVAKGATFHNAFTTTPICCPSRSSFLTGIYSHNHNVLTNHENCSSPLWQKTHETRTFATYLNKSGYATGYFGKYLNEYNGTYIPPGWEYWMGLRRNSRYYNYTLRHNDRMELHRDVYEKDYLTDLIVNRSMSYFQQRKTEDPDKPVFAMLSFPAPHGSEDAAPQYQNLYANISSHITPSFDFGPNPDKHWIISRTKVPMQDSQHRFSALLQQKRLQTLRSVDDGVQRFVKMLEDTEELDNTYLLYTSDHGYHIGQFGLAKGKSMPYDFDIRVPFYLRGPGVPPGMRIKDIVLNIDIAPTILGIAGVDIPEWMDGRNFMPLIKSRTSISPPWRDTFLIERGEFPHTKLHLAKPKIPSKQKIVEETCKNPNFKYPCGPMQEWTCAYEDGILKMRKCNKYKKMTSFSVLWRTRIHRQGCDRTIKYTDKMLKNKRCPCPKKVLPTSNRLPLSCRRRLESIMRVSRGKRRQSNRRSIKLRNEERQLKNGEKYRNIPRNRHKYLNRRRYKRRVQSKFDITEDDGRTNSTVLNRNQRLLTSQCSIDIRTYKIKCVEGTVLKPGYWTNHIQILKLQLRMLKIISECKPRRPKRREKCKCTAAEKARALAKRREARVNDTSVHPMRLIFQKVRQGHNENLQKFKEERREYLSTRPQKTIRKTIRKARNCSTRGMKCFSVDQNLWSTKPFWDGPQQCYCTNAKNNTYWCIRIINETSNVLYCEFVTGFVEYYDLLQDPYQRSNTYYDLTSEVHTALNAELAQLRVCKGASQCHVSRESNQSASSRLPTTTTPTTTTTEAPTTSTTQSVAPNADLEFDVAEDIMQSTTTPTITNHVPTNYPRGTRYPHAYRQKRRRLNRNRNNACSASMKRRHPIRWNDLCSSKKKQNNAQKSQLKVRRERHRNRG